MVCLPSLAHELIAHALADAAVSCPVLLNPGHTGGALHMAAIFGERGVDAPPIVEFSTLTYVARKPDAASVRITGAAGRVWAACLPGGDEALTLSRTLYQAAAPARDVIASSLANVNLVLEDFGYGLVPMLELARIGGVAAPYAAALVETASVLRGEDLRATGLTTERLGIAGLDRDGLLACVRGPA